MMTPWFPDLRGDDRSPDALLGGELTLPWVMAAYPRGFFPWPMEGEPLAWWCPRVRMIFEPEEMHLSRSLRKTLRRERYRVTLDTAFDDVIAGCRDKRGPDRDGTWITGEMVAIYTELHRMGLAHSVEAWDGETLVAGVYGLAIGGTFYGESMYADSTDASKVALVSLGAQLDLWGFDQFDCQVPNDHLISMGGVPLIRSAFLDRLAPSVQRPSRTGTWRIDADAVREHLLARPRFEP
tara:strand:- start:14512 stop:15225 length:714 start_codon:yes stop_codon:yes gene_type:complete